MPVESGEIHGGEIRGAEVAAQGAPDQPGDHRQSADHMDSVESGHHEIDAEEELHLGFRVRRAGLAGARDRGIGGAQGFDERRGQPLGASGRAGQERSLFARGGRGSRRGSRRGKSLLRWRGDFAGGRFLRGAMLARFYGGLEVFARQDAVFPFVFVFDEFHAHESESADDRGGEQRDEQAALAELRRAHAPGHRETAEEQDAGIERAQFGIQVFVAVIENLGMIGAVNGVSAKQAAEEENFGGEKNPHAEFAGFKFRRGAIEMMRVSRQAATPPRAAGAARRAPDQDSRNTDRSETNPSALPLYSSFVKS